MSDVLQSAGTTDLQRVRQRESEVRERPAVTNRKVQQSPLF